jgi:hypothetical protein
MMPNYNKFVQKGWVQTAQISSIGRIWLYEIHPCFVCPIRLLFAPTRKKVILNDSNLKQRINSHTCTIVGGGYEVCQTKISHLLNLVFFLILGTKL